MREPITINSETDKMTILFKLYMTYSNFMLMKELLYANYKSCESPI